MNGIHAACTGRIGTNAELKHSKGGKSWAAFSVAVNQEDTEAPATWVRVAIFGDKAEGLAHRLTKGLRFTVRVSYSWEAGPARMAA